MESIEFTIPGDPIGQPRPRATIRGSRASVYNPRHKVDGYKAAISLACQSAYSGPQLSGPVTVEIEAVFDRPQRLIWKTRPMTPTPHTSKPDCDNIAKSCLDALDFLWQDDAQVSEMRIRKRYRAGDELPHTAIRITHLATPQTKGCDV